MNKNPKSEVKRRNNHRQRGELKMIIRTVVRTSPCSRIPSQPEPPADPARALCGGPAPPAGPPHTPRAPLGPGCTPRSPFTSRPQPQAGHAAGTLWRPTEPTRQRTRCELWKAGSPRDGCGVCGGQAGQGAEQTGAQSQGRSSRLCDSTGTGESS